ncbi:unnamed protein product, partial [Durusdinium trenchii]
CSLRPRLGVGTLNSPLLRLRSGRPNPMLRPRKSWRPLRLRPCSRATQSRMP